MIHRIAAIALLAAVTTSAPAQSPEGGSDEGGTWRDTATEALSDMSCPDAGILGTSLMTNVCWDCIFPIRIGGEVGFGGGDAPDGAADSALCACGPGEGTAIGKIGITVSMFQPARIIETVSTPMCFPSLGGMDIDRLADVTGSLRMGKHTAAVGDSNSDLNFAHFHYYAFPLTAILGLFDVQQCLNGGFSDVDLLFFSETMPNWHDSRLSSLINPEVAMFAGLTSAAVMPVDCVASTFDEPIDSLYWVAGCWGAVYNPVGYGGSHHSPVGFSSLISARALHLLARIGFIERRMGDDAICEGKRTPLLVKSMYRMQMMFPSAEAEPGVGQIAGGSSDGEDGPATSVDESGSGESDSAVLEVTPNTDTCCHPIGKSTLTWGEWRSRPTKDHYVWLVSRWVDCCIGYEIGN